MPYYVNCPYYLTERYPSKKAKTEAQKKQGGGATMICCECARIIPPSKKSRAYLYEHFCATDEWNKCAIAQVLDEFYKDQGVGYEIERIKPTFNKKTEQD